jgi:GNAT superfamily N-acetyltransferase
VIEPSAPPAGVTLRPAGPDDRPFLFLVYASTRCEELLPLGWDAEATQSFLRTQFEHEDRDWHLHQPGAECMVVLREGRPVGRLYLARSAQEIRVMDLTLLPEHRGQGIGTSLIASLLDEARRTRRTVRMNVGRSSPMGELCRKLGFLPAATRGGTWLMEWTAPGGNAGIWPHSSGKCWRGGSPPELRASARG